MLWWLTRTRYHFNLWFLSSTDIHILEWEIIPPVIRSLYLDANHQLGLRQQLPSSRHVLYKPVYTMPDVILCRLLCYAQNHNDPNKLMQSNYYEIRGIPQYELHDCIQKGIRLIISIPLTLNSDTFLYHKMYSTCIEKSAK